MLVFVVNKREKGIGRGGVRRRRRSGLIWIVILDGLPKGPLILVLQ